MSRLQPIQDKDTAGSLKSTFQAIEANFGMVPNLFRTLGHNEAVLHAVLELNKAVEESSLPANFRELAYLQASVVNQCDYCSHYHAKQAKKEGYSAEQVASIQKEQTPAETFSSEDRAIIEFTRSLTKSTHASEESYANVREFLDDSQMVALVGTICLANSTNRINHAFDIELP